MKVSRLSARIIFGTVAIYTLVIAVLMIVLQFIVDGGTQDLENRIMLRNLALVQSSWNERLAELSDLGQEYAAWDDTLDFLASSDQHYIANNLPENWQERSPLDLIIFVRNDGFIPWARWIHQAGSVTVTSNRGDAPEIRRIAALTLRASQDFHGLARQTLLVNSDHGPLLMAICPVIHSNFSGEPAGRLVFGRLFSNELLGKLARTTQTVLTLELSDLPFNPVIAGKDSQVIRDPTSMTLSLDLPYWEGSGGVHIIIREERSSWAMGRNILRMQAIATIVAGLALAFGLIILLRILVLHPLRAVARHMRLVNTSGDYHQALPNIWDDELGDLAADYNRLLDAINLRNDSLEKLNRELESIAYIDRLTGLANRRLFDRQSSQEIRRLKREHRSDAHNGHLGLIMVDVDFFKQYNDLYGHLEGDTCLATLGACMAACLRRATDLACRFGGEEFVILLPECDINGAMVVAENVRYQIEQLALPHGSSSVAPVVTVSLGVSASLVDEDFSLEALLHAADLALYEAKAQGRNRAVIKKYR